MVKETTVCYEGQVYQVEYDTNRVMDELEITIKSVWVSLVAPFFKGGEVILTVYTDGLFKVDDVDISEFIDKVETIEDEIRELVNK